MELGARLGKTIRAYNLCVSWEEVEEGMVGEEGVLLSFIGILCPQCLYGEPFCDIPPKTSEVAGNGHHVFSFPYYRVIIHSLLVDVCEKHWVPL